MRTWRRTQAKEGGFEFNHPHPKSTSAQSRLQHKVNLSGKSICGEVLAHSPPAPSTSAGKQRKHLLEVEVSFPLKLSHLIGAQAEKSVRQTRISPEFFLYNRTEVIMPPLLFPAASSPALPRPPQAPHSSPCRLLPHHYLYISSFLTFP